VPRDRYNDVIGTRILRGYLHSGFADAKVVVSTTPSAGVTTATINEGNQRFCGDVCVSGLTAKECEFVASLIRSDTDLTCPTQNKNSLQESQPGLKFWKPEVAMSFVKTAEQPNGQEALTAVGYP